MLVALVLEWHMVHIVGPGIDLEAHRRANHWVSTCVDANGPNQCPSSRLAVPTHNDHFRVCAADKVATVTIPGGNMFCISFPIEMLKWSHGKISWGDRRFVCWTTSALSTMSSLHRDQPINVPIVHCSFVDNAALWTKMRSPTTRHLTWLYVRDHCT